jgi:CSLREA domain-containing protein
MAARHPLGGRPVHTRGLRRLGAVALVTLLACAATAGPARGATFNVNSTNDDTDLAPGDGLCASFASGCTLRAAIQESNARPGPDAINLPAGTYELEIPPLNLNDITTGDLDITEAVRITGAGAASTVVDGGVPKPGSPPEVRGRDRLFDVQAPSGSVRLSGLTIRDGYAAEHGGGLLNAAGATVRLTNVAMTGNFAGETGGAVDNRAGGSVYLTGSNISGNAANQSGGALNNNQGGTLSVSTTTVSQNSAVVVGEDPSLTGAGAIANNAELDAKGTITVSGSTISDNHAGGSANNGGAISNDGGGTVTVVSSSILRNSTEAEGGAIYNGSGEVTVRGSKLSENVADNGGAIYSSVNGSGRLVVENSTISLNQARARGGGVSGNGTGDVRLTNVSFTKNSAHDWGGGVVNDDKAGVTIARSRFSGNSALSGGGFANEGTGPVTVTDSTFTNNRAALDGGGLHTNSVDELSVTGGSFSLNKAMNGGGLSNEGGGVVAVSGTIFSKNSAQQEGGGVLVQSGQVSLTDVDVLDNVANSTVQGGGGISFQGDKVVSVGESATIENSVIEGNVASLTGGGIDSRGDGPLDIAMTTIESNTAKVGGGLHHVGDAPLEIKRSMLAMNASEGGGGLFTDGDGETTVENSTISTNTASQFGGGLLVKSRLTARSTTITGNSSPSGGGINNGGSDPVGDGFVFLRNTIVAGNPTGGNCVGTVTSHGGNIDSADTCRFRELSDQTSTDPLLGPLADNGGPTLTHPLTAGSPAQDAAVHTLSEPCPPTDQRGAVRPHGPGCDSGAYESELEPTTPPGDCVERVERLVLADSDSWIAQGAPSNTFGNDAILKVRSQSAANARSLVHFGLPTPPAGC